MVALRLWLVRHGATDWSEAGRLCGSTDVPLSRGGEAQADPIRRSLAARSFDGVWCSDLARAREYARLAVGRATPDRRLRELDFGELEGKRWDDLDPATRQSLVRFEGFVAPGGESVAQLEERVGRFLAELGRGDHLVVTHGGVIRLLARRCGVLFAPQPGEMTVLEWDSVDAR
ncbi:MAG TPA: histidine phosphatase family protein [Acidimicrobiia bacterium]|nr:histidine phosphatase family protein [Acidimicrobiia bacterium]